MDNKTKLALITVITNNTDSNEYKLAEKLLEILGVRAVDALDKEPLDVFSEDELVEALKSEGCQVTDNDDKENYSLNDALGNNTQNDLDKLSIFKK